MTTKDKDLAARIRRLEDIEAIRKLQYAYCFYIQHWQEEEHPFDDPASRADAVSETNGGTSHATQSTAKGAD